VFDISYKKITVKKCLNAHSGFVFGLNLILFFSIQRIFPNVYEAIARIHNGESAGAAHGGQAFLAWHTIYLLL